MTLRVVYETNVIVSAALKPGGLPASLVALAMAKAVRLFLSPAILEEYDAVLKRPKFRLDPKAVEASSGISETPRSWSGLPTASVGLPMSPTIVSSSAPSRPELTTS
jgi:hypothetical protein